MDKFYYPAVLERSAEGSYGVFFPDLPGCVAVADNEIDIWAQAEAALHLHVAGLIEDGDILPMPSALSSMERDPEVDQLAVALLGVESEPEKVRVNVMMEPGVLKAIDLVSDNRSQFLTRAAKAALWQIVKRGDAPERDPKTGEWKEPARKKRRKRA